ncbi:hypothetical protein [Chryseolinea lacunae]|uniref:Uncharacterized protein n=1 Tax=Chryseolinea lacunae TaxID=2801331 RepID=A0ABS1L1V5_9BACT|nr:hypothetical protein [Chryseolinea lacunae]MBL0745665.1 hypothetical protein [Chryseolinea lacunae]
MKVLVFSILFFLTFKHAPVNRLIERADWFILYDRRMAVVDKVKRKELRPHRGSKNGICELPYEFPVVSNGGNDISVWESDEERMTISFWIFRNYFEAPSTRLMYTTDEKRIEEFEKRISRDADNNWKIEENWYRTLGD